MWDIWMKNFLNWKKKTFENEENLLLAKPLAEKHGFDSMHKTKCHFKLSYFGKRSMQNSGCSLYWN